MAPRTLIRAALLATAALLAFPAAGLADFDGSLNVGFDGPLGGGNGKFAHSVGGIDDEARDVVVQADGKIVVVGTADNGSGFDLAIARFNGANGTLDSTFDGPSGSGNGDFILHLSNTGSTFTTAVTLDSAGRIVVGGSADFPTTLRDQFVARFDPSDGDFDDSFSGDGIATTSFSGADESVNAMVTDGADRPILVGTAGNDMAVSRFEADGDPDNTFSGDGKQTVDVGSSDQGNAVMVQPDGKIVIGARTSTTPGGFDFAVARLNPADGSLDTSFDGPSTGTSTTFPGNGKFAFPVSPGTGQDVGTSLLMQGTNRILVGGDAFVGATSSFAIARLSSADGSFDNSFDGDGIVTTDLTSSTDRIEDMEIDSKGRIVAAGFGFPSGDEWAAARYSANGVLDPFFDGDSGTANGKLEIPFPTSGSARALDIETDGDLVLAGETGGVSDTFALARLNVDLTEPNTFLSGATGQTADSNPAFSITSTETASSVQCTLDAAPVACAIGAGQQFGPLADGPHTLTAAAVDEAGNQDSVAATRNFTVDTTAPNGSIAAIPALSNDATPSLGFSSNEAGSTFQCKLDPPAPAPAGSFAPCTSPFEPGPLPDGAYTLTLRTTDAVANVDSSDATASFTIDTIVPTVAITSGPPAVVKTKKRPILASFVFSSSDPSAVRECSLDGAPFATCSSPFAATLAIGSHSLRVRARDAAGNLSATATRSVLVRKKKKRRKK